MTLQQLRYSIAIAEYGSINAAAQNLYASQSRTRPPSRSLSRAGHHRVHAQQPRRDADERRHRASGYAPGDRAGRHAGDATPIKLHPPAAGRVHAALRVQRAGVRERGGSLQGRGVRVHPAREHHGRDHRRRARSAARWASCTPTTSTGACCEGVRHDADVAYAPVRRACTCSWAAPPAGGRRTLLLTRRPGRLPALLVRTGHHELVLLFRGALSRLPH